jgi:hypothetical protein
MARWPAVRKRSARPTQPASNRCRRVAGPQASLACEDRKLVGCARASFQGCRSRQATPISKEAHPAGNGEACTGIQPPRLQRASGVERYGEEACAVAKPSGQFMLEPDARRGVAGRKLLIDRRHLRSSRQCDTVHAGVLRTISAAFLVAFACERIGTRAEKRQRCQRLGRASRPAEANRTEREQANFPDVARAASPRTPSGTNEAWVLVGNT